MPATTHEKEWSESDCLLVPRRVGIGSRGLRQQQRTNGLQASRRDASSRNFETWGNHNFQKNFRAGKWPAAHERTPRFVTNSRLRNPQFRDVPLVHSFRGQKIHHMPPEQVNISFVRQNSDNSYDRMHIILCTVCSEMTRGVWWQSHLSIATSPWLVLELPCASFAFCCCLRSAPLPSA